MESDGLIWEDGYFWEEAGTPFVTKEDEELVTRNDRIFTVYPYILQKTTALNSVISGDMGFSDNKIKGGKIYFENSIVFDELSTDTFEASIDFSEEVGTIFAPREADVFSDAADKVFTVRPYFHVMIADPAQYKYGRRVEYHRNGELFAAFYMESLKRISQYYYSISCVSSVGLLDTFQHYGGLYTGQKFEEVVNGIIKNAVPYTVAANVKNLPVYGWLPVATARDNLRQLLFATGVSVRKNNDGNISFELLNSSVPFDIADNRIMLGGSVDFPAAASEAVVVEHSFFSTSLDETVTLYEGPVMASTFTAPSGVKRTGILVTFNEPAYGFAVVGSTILESGVNYAVLSPGGSATLTGKKYTHTTREVQKTISASDNIMVGDQNVARVENATLVTVLNSEAVVDRVASYYSSKRSVKSKILVESERPGDAVSFQNPFRGADSGLIASMDITISGTLLADSEVIAGYTPVSGGAYENRALLTGNGTFTVPAGKTKIHVILIGGAYGGYSGLKGKSSSGTSRKNTTLPGGTMAYLPVGKGGDGGEAGEGGQGGAIFQTTVYVTPGQQFSYRCGAGGAGGVSNKNRASEDDNSAPGSAGGATTFGSLSSASGTSSVTGYLDVFTGTIYGQPGDAGVPGGKGGGLDEVTENWQLNFKQNRGPNLVYNGATYRAGETNEDYVSTEYTSQVYQANASYGAGGGAAAGANGFKATNPPSASVSSFGSAGQARGGAGGQGADAAAPAAETRYGTGGRGGNGGGGEGGTGYAAVEGYPATTGSNPSLPSNLSLSQTTGVNRGLGSDGGRGGPGCVLVYY